jgi:hypothetical protein
LSFVDGQETSLQRPAALRSGGFHYPCCGALLLPSALPFLRASCRRCAKPIRCTFGRFVPLRFPLRASRFALPALRFPLRASRFPLCASRFALCAYLLRNFPLYVVTYVALRPRLTYNGMAAWRSGGFYALPFKRILLLHFAIGQQVA